MTFGVTLTQARSGSVRVSLSLQTLLLQESFQGRHGGGFCPHRLHVTWVLTSALDLLVTLTHPAVCLLTPVAHRGVKGGAHWRIEADDG